MPTAKDVDNNSLLRQLRNPDCYDHPVGGQVVVHETHISWVFLAGRFAYKVKKPITNDFLDYGSLSRRKRMCEEELRLDARYAPDLYLGVVPITCSEDGPRINGAGDPVEYAIKMHRFPEDALLSHRMKHGTLTTNEVRQLATLVADFHLKARRADRETPWGSADLVFESMWDIIGDLHAVRLDPPEGPADVAKQLKQLQHWATEFFDQHRLHFQQRIHNGFIRECHGDLHLANVFEWDGRLLPFDGIEFNDQFRWIDVLSDAAFLAMDLAAGGHIDLSRLFIDAYLERTGDHASLALLRWYLVFRALVRAKVAALRAAQMESSSTDCRDAIGDCRHHVELAVRFSTPEEPRLWITHGFSGSGKSTGSEAVIARHGAIRLRGDVERKRHYGIPIGHRPDPAETKQIYSAEGNDATYGRMRRLSRCMLEADVSVVVDATFLRRKDRELFRELAESCDVPFAILDFKADESVLRQRIADRIANGHDASDAGLAVLQQQLEHHQPLTADEHQYVVEIPDLNSIVQQS